MMRCRPLAFMMLTVAALLMFAFPVWADSAGDDDPADVVWRAFRDLARSDGYAFTAELVGRTEVISELEFEDDVTEFILRATGEVDADGNYRITRSATVDRSLDDEIEFSDEWPVERLVERLTIGDDVYVNLSDEYADMLRVEAGWWRMDELAVAHTDQAFETFFDIFIDSEQSTWILPADMLPSQSIILEITGTDEGEIDGEPMLIYDIEIDGMLLWLNESGISTAEAAALRADPEFRENSRFEEFYRVWIGADDGRLYRIEAATDRIVWYGEALTLIEDFTTHVEISHADEPFTFTPPELVVPADD